MRRSSLLQVTVSLLIISLLAFFVWVQSPFFGRVVYPWRFRNEIFDAAQKYGVDPYLVAAIAYTESKYDPRARSPKGAMGLMQLMPETAGWIAEQLKWTSFSTEQLYDPRVNIELGCWYLANLTVQFDDLAKVIAAYNAGRGNLQKWLDQGTWDGRFATVDSIPFGETRDYVRKVAKHHRYYRNLYGPQVAWLWWK
ncbi:MAG: lytic transglycosylase domain-containing protein [Bacillota bacterium]